MRVALVHDDFVQLGGAESLFATIASIYPNAPIYTSLVDWNKLPKSINHDRIKTSFMQKIPYGKKLYKVLLPLYPLAFENFDFSSFDLVISSTTRFAKGIIAKPNTIHVCYINNVPRFLWNKETRQDYLPSILRFLAKPVFVWLRRWDKAAANRPDYYIANSQNVADRLKKYYGIESSIIYPFADLDFFTPAKIHNWKLKSQKYLLVVSRLAKWKRISLAIKAALELNLDLIIIGDGPDRSRLEKLSHGNKSKITFAGKVARRELLEFYQNAQALVVTQEEDFGISMVEAQSTGIPVIAYKKGGALEIIKEEETGLFFPERTAKSLEDAISHLSDVKWNSQAIRKNVSRFRRDVFVKELKARIDYVLKPQRP